jgi:hypothetical protein
VEGVMAVYSCYLTNKSKYDLKLVSAEAEQFGFFHRPWSREFNPKSPDLIKAGHIADRHATFTAEASDLDGIRIQVQYILMLDGKTVPSYVTIWATRGNDAFPPDLSVFTGPKSSVSESRHDPNHGPFCNHWITTTDNTAADAAIETDDQQFVGLHAAIDDVSARLAVLRSLVHSLPKNK